MSAVGVLGGSFSPVHKGHLEVARTVVERGLVDEVWLMPCRRNPLKDGSTTMPDAERLRLLNKAADYYNGLMEREAVRVKDTELGMPEPSFTADTLRKLSVEYPGIELRLITGADSYINFNRWKEWRWIEANFRPIVYPRPGYPLVDLRPAWTLLDEVRETDISSTRLREIINSGAESDRETLFKFMPWLNK